MRIDRFLIISAGGETRVVNRPPVLRLDEFMYRLVITIPSGWGSILGEIALTLPEPNPTVELDEVEPDEVEEE